MSLKVIGTGFGRTGTMSLKFALEQLGFGPCYGMMEVFGHPGHAEAWHAIAKGTSNDWRSLLDTFSSVVDWPTTYFWRELVAANPQAKIILTERDAHAWYKSMSSTILVALGAAPSADQPPFDPLRRAQFEMAREIVVKRTFGGKLDEDSAIAAYRRHNDEVKRAIPSAQLLVYDSQGWEPLCAFLGVPVPATPYPKTNSTDEFGARNRRRV